MKLQTFVKTLIAFAIFFVAAGAFAQSRIDNDYERCREAYHELVGSGKKKMRHNWIKVIKCFEGISSTQAKHSRVLDAMFTLGMLYKHLYTYSSIESDLSNALRYFKKVVDTYPESSLADDALYNRGKMFFERGEYTKAYLDLTELVEKYPGSDSAKRSTSLFADIKKAKPKDDEIARKIADKDFAKETKGEVVEDKVLINEIKHWTNPDYTRVAIYLNSRAEFTYNTLDLDETNLRPRRLYVDIKDSSVARNISENIPIRDGLLAKARIGKPKKGMARVVLDAEKEFDHNVFAWEDPFRIIIDIKSKGSTPRQTQVVDLSREALEKKQSEIEIKEEPVPRVVKKPARRKVPELDLEKEEKKEKSKTSERWLSLAKTPVAKGSATYIRRIVLDPGHGGHDTGARGRNGTMEKDVVLAIAKELRDMLSREDNIEVIMTRETDKFVPLEERTGIAVQAEADLFISIHADAHKSSKVSGISTYLLGDTDDKDSIMTALKENYSTRDYIGGIESKETKDLLSYTFASLQKNYDAIRSVPLADAVQKEALKSLRHKYTSVRDRRVRRGIFWVLCGTNSPAVLIESSYITNPVEERRLASGKYRRTLAQGIAKGIKKYLSNPVAMSGYDYLPGKSMAR